MKTFAIFAVSALATIASATNHGAASYCSGAAVTETVTVTVDPPAASQTSTPTINGVPSGCEHVPGATKTVVVTGGFNPDGTNTLAFEPPFIPQANRCDRFVFDFRKMNHTLTESTLAAPCTKKQGTLIDTNFKNVNVADIPLQNATTFILDTDASMPRYFYCKQANTTPRGHCSNGMIFALNINQGRFDDFVKNAKATLPKPTGLARRFRA